MDEQPTTARFLDTLRHAADCRTHANTGLGYRGQTIEACSCGLTDARIDLDRRSEALALAKRALERQERNLYECTAKTCKGKVHARNLDTALLVDLRAALTAITKLEEGEG